VTNEIIAAALAEACPGLRIDDLRPLDAGHTSRQWVADTDEGRLLVKTPVRDADPEHLRRLIATTRRAAEGGVPVVRFRAFVPHSTALGAPLLVQEFQDGEPADAAWAGMGPVERIAFAADLGRLVARVHRCTGPWFGDALGRVRHPGARAYLHALVDTRIGEAPEDLTVAGRDGLAAALHRAVEAAVADDEPPALTHGDLWRQNLILRDGRIACLLDFEHGRYADRFLDFGKLDEHVFAGFPDGREAFLSAYDEAFPLPPGWPARVSLGNAVHALSMAVYFRRWEPLFVPEYVAALDAWLD